MRDMTLLDTACLAALLLLSLVLPLMLSLLVMRSSRVGVGTVVLILTVSSALPGLIWLVFGIAEYRRPHDYSRNPDPELSYTIPIYFTFFCAFATFLVSSLGALVFQLFMRKDKSNDENA